MSHHSPNGENCLICKDRAERHQAHQEGYLDEGDALLAEALKAGKRIKASLHFRDRGILRCFADKDIANAIRSGYVIERQKDAWLINSSIKIGEKKYRPIHVAVIIQEEAILVKTAYDPRSNPWKWDNAYTKRVCWCKKSENEV